jgi:DNA-directed RNA polymerase subunit RPC12/RpoP
MRLQLILPTVKQEAAGVRCPHCQSKGVKVHEVVAKQV